MRKLTLLVVVATITSTALLLATPVLAKVITGTNQDDVLKGTAGQDHINGLDGKDTILGKAATDDLFGGRAADEIRGGPSTDDIIGGRGPDTIFGGRGGDVINTHDGFIDKIVCGASQDLVYADDIKFLSDNIAGDCEVVNPS